MKAFFKEAPHQDAREEAPIRTCGPLFFKAQSWHLVVFLGCVIENG